MSVGLYNEAYIIMWYGNEFLMLSHCLSVTLRRSSVPCPVSTLPLLLNVGVVPISTLRWTLSLEAMVSIYSYHDNLALQR